MTATDPSTAAAPPRPTGHHVPAGEGRHSLMVDGDHVAEAAVRLAGA